VTSVVWLSVVSTEVSAGIRRLERSELVHPSRCGPRCVKSKHGWS